MSTYSHFFLNSVRQNNQSPQQVYTQHYRLVKEYQLQRLNRMKFVLNLIDGKIRETRVYTEDPVEQEMMKKTVGLLLDMRHKIYKHIAGDSMNYLGSLEKVLKFEGLN
jgi:hypothetical protein